MIANELESLIPSINIERDYWFIRTDDGMYFDAFYDGGYVGIGWNEVSIKDLRKISPDGSEIKDKIGTINNHNSSTRSGKKRITETFNKILRFRDLKKGDIVLIPSNSSSRIAFGEIKDDHIYEGVNDDCPYLKRRKVNWIKVCNINSLDSKFYTIKLSRHSISNINKYSYLIDNITNSVYKKGEYCYYCFNVNTTNDINLKTLTQFITSITSLCEVVNEEFNLGEDVSKIAITLNLQSPGKMVIKLKHGLSYLIIAGLITGCTTGNASTDAQINKLKPKINKDLLDSVNIAKEELDIESDAIR